MTTLAVSIRRGHRVVRPVPDVGAEPAREPRRAELLPRQPGRPAGRDFGVKLGAGRRASAQRRVVAAGDQMQFEVGARGEPARECDRVDAGADRPGREPQRRRGATRTRGVYERRCASARVCSGGVGFGRALPGQLAGRRARPLDRSSSRSCVVVEHARRARRCSRRRRPARTAVRRRARTLPSRSRSSSPSAVPRAIASRAGSPKPSYSDATQNASRAPVQGVDDAPRLRAEHANERVVEIRSRRPSPRGPTTTSVRRGWPAPNPFDSVDDRRQVLAGFDRPDREHKGLLNAGGGDCRVELVVVARQRARRCRRARPGSASGANPSRSSSRRVNADGAMISDAVAARELEAARVELHAAPRRGVRDAQERDVVHGHDERA